MSNNPGHLSMVLVVLAHGVIACGGDSGPRPTDDVAETSAELDGADISETGDPTDTDGPDSAETTIDASDVDTAEVVDPGCLGPIGVPGSTTASLTDALGNASVTIDDRAACIRTYRLSSTAELRDDLPVSPRVIVERADKPRLRTGHDLFDAAYALAIDEVRECSVAQITDNSFNGGRPLPCPAGGCFETGRKWPWVWTRDTAYAIHLGLAALDPVRAKNSLMFKLSERRGGGDLQVVQDTGSGGAWPVSTDRVVWALGARAVLGELVGSERESFRATTIEALRNTVEQDRRAVWDPESGLYFGEQSFLDWREQSYPNWTRNDVIDVATSRSLSTNLLHLAALELLADLLVETDSDATRYRNFAADLRTAIARELWLPERKNFSTYLASPLDPSPVRRFDLLGSALAILLDVASPAQSLEMLASYPSYGPAAPVIWPQQQLISIYHNRASWPFVTAYWLAAARHAEQSATTPPSAANAVDGTADHLVDGLWRAAVLNLSNMENLEGQSGAPYVDDGTYSGPIVNSQRQLWSVAGYVGMVQQTLFGLRSEPTGLRVAPWLTRGMRDELFGHTDELVLVDMPHRGRRVTVRVALPPIGSGGLYSVAELKVDGVVRASDEVIPLEVLADRSLVDVVLVAEPNAASRSMTSVSADDWRNIFSPRTPSVRSIEADGGKLRLALRTFEDDRDALTFDIWRDGTRVATGLAGTSESWLDPDSDATTGRSPCYVVEARFASGNFSQRSRATCWWGAQDQNIRLIDATSFIATGGTAVTEHDRFHYREWGDQGHRLEIRDIVATTTGRHLFQVTYGNGAGPINTGIACGTKALTVTDRESGAVVAEAMLVMPQLGRWDRWALSNYVTADLVAGRTYDVVIAADDRFPNMSVFAAFETYGSSGALGGTGGAFNRVNIAELRILVR